MSYLCLKNKSIDRKTQNTGGKMTVSNLSLTNVFKSNVSDADVLLPTLTCQLVGSNNHVESIRVMKDGGCQRNFIAENIALKYKFPIISDNVTITIHGFNSSRTINTRIVRVSLLLDEDVVYVDAVCVPSIDVSFNAGNIENLVEGFESKGYRLADQFISSKCPSVVDNINMILGTENDYILPLKYVTFGKGKTLSSYIDTPLGVMLSGRVDTLLDNM